MINNSFIRQIEDCIPDASSARIQWEKIEPLFTPICFSGMKRTQQNPFYHGEGDVYTHTQMVYRELIEMPDLISFRETVCALVRHHMLPIHLMVREDPERKIQEVAALGELAEDFRGSFSVSSRKRTHGDGSRMTLRKNW